MIYPALVESFDSVIEEEVTVVIAGQRLTCFANYAPYLLEAGKVYPVELSCMVFEDYSVEEVADQVPAIIRTGNAYAYRIIGELVDDCLRSCGLEFQDEVLLSDFGFLEGRVVSWKIDRLDIRFL